MPRYTIYEMTHADEAIRATGGGICPTLQHRMGTGGNQVPMIIDAVCIADKKFKDGDVSETAHTLITKENAQPCVAYTLKIRSGCEGGGKGALIQTEKSATLATNNDQYLFQPVIAIDKESYSCGGGGTEHRVLPLGAHVPPCRQVVFPTPSVTE